MLRFVDSFTHYTQAFMPAKWDVCLFGAGVSQTMAQGIATGRFGKGGVTFAGTETFAFTDLLAYCQRNYDGVSTIVVGMALKQTTTQVNGNVDSGGGGRWLSFLDGATLQVALNILPSGQIIALRNNVAGQGLFPNILTRPIFTTLGTSASSISSSSYDFLEVKIVHHATTGSITIKRNGSVFWSLTNVNTAISASNNSSSVIVGGGQWAAGGSSYFSPLNAIMSDFYLLDTVAGADGLDPVDFIGDRHWEVLTPTADGADAAWATTGSGNHFANVDEIPPNTTDFNSTATLNARDGFVVSAPTGPATASVIVCLTMYLQKTTGGSNAVKGFIRSAVPAYALGTEFQVPNPWAFRQSFLFSKPGGGAITIADVSTHQMGYQKTI